MAKKTVILAGQGERIKDEDGLAHKGTKAKELEKSVPRDGKTTSATNRPTSLHAIISALQENLRKFWFWDLSEAACYIRRMHYSGHTVASRVLLTFDRLT